MKTSNKILATLFIALFLIAISTMTYVRANSVVVEQVTAEGKISVHHYDIQDLHTLDIQYGNVTLYQGEPYVEVKCADNIHEHLNMEVKDGVLTFKILDRAQGKVDIKISTKDIENINLFGSASLEAKDIFKTDMLNISAQHSNSITLPLEANIVTITCSESTEINLSGQANVVNASVTNSGNINATNLEAKVVNANVSEGGKLFTSVKDNLIINVHNSGEVLYKGDPEVKINNQSEGGKITKL